MLSCDHAEIGYESAISYWAPDQHIYLEDVMQRTKTIYLARVLALTVLLWMSLPLFAQSTLGSIHGTVTDASGAAMAGAQVTLTNTATGYTRNAVTDTNGLYNFLDVQAGHYSVLVQSQGFASRRQNDIVLYANQAVTVDSQLKLSNVQTTLVVNSAASVIDTQNANLSDVLTGKSLLHVPLLSRQTGATGIWNDFFFAPGASGPPNGNTPAINGARQEDTMVTMDGMVVMSTIGQEGGTPVQPSEESIQEIHSVLADAPAEFWRPAAITVVTKPGGNQIHGSLFEMWNGDSLNARNYFASTVPFAIDNTFAASITGPVKRDKLFYTADYEGGRDRSHVILNSSVPLTDWTIGNFQSVSKQLVDPYNGQPFQGNQIPSGMISSIAQNLQKALYPAPNYGAPGLLAGNFRDQIPGQNGFTVFDSGDGSLQYNISPNDSVYFRNSYRELPVTSFEGALPATGNYIEHRIAASGVVSETHVFSPTLLNELRLGYTDMRLNYNMVFNGYNLLTNAGMQGPWGAAQQIEAVPSITITGVSGTSGLLPANNYGDRDYEWNDNLSWNIGKHVVKMGVDQIFDRVYLVSNAATVFGGYTFSGIYTGSAYADFLLGLPYQTSLTTPATMGNINATTLGIYAQDQYQLTRRLSINYGLRWEYNGPYHGAGAFDELFSFDPKNGDEVVSSQSDLNHVSPYFPTGVVSLETASEAGYPSGSLMSSHYLNFYPRVGFAYRLFSSPGTVVRGAYGLYAVNEYASYGVVGMLEGSGPFRGTATFTNAIANGQARFSFPDPFQSTGTLATQTVAAANPNNTIPNTQQWNLSLEQSLGSNLVATAAYVGSAVRNLWLGSNLDQPAPSTTPFSTSELAYPQYSSVTWYQNTGIDNYNSLQFSLRRNGGKNLSFDTGLTFSRDLTDDTDTGSFAGASPENRFCLSCEYSNNPETRRWDYYARADYILPFEKLHAFSGNHDLWLNNVVGGWSVAGDSSIASGTFFSPTLSGPDTANTNTSFAQRPDLIGDPHVANETIDNWFNVGAYAIPGCPTTDPQCAHTTRADVGRFGDLRPATLEGPNYADVDFSLTKQIKVERGAFEFTLDSNDVLNHPNFALPQASITAATAGVITGTSGSGNRQTDISARFDF